MSKRKLSRIFQIRLLLAVLICFLITLACLWKTQKSIARSIAYETMLHNIDDTLQSIQDISDSTIIGIAKKISQKLDSETGISENLLTNLCEEWQINEINVINADGIITQSTNKKFIGYSMASGTQSAEFMPILRGEITEFAQKYQPISYDPGKSMKYAGAALKKGGFAQIGYSGDNFNRNLEGHIKDLVKNRRVGILGTVIIVDENWDIIGETVLKDYTESIYKPDKIKEFISNLKAEESSGEKGIEASPVPGEKNRSGFSLRITDKEKDQEGLFEPEINEISFYALMHKKEGFAAIALLPKFEQSISNFVALFVLVVLEFIVFLILFFTIYYLVQKIVVSNLNRINVSLDKITKGNLDETVSVNYSREFEKLSGGINAMVASLKRNIKETAARIDEELAFAKAVQHSSMPSVFPPFPDRKDFDIFAMMETAKEVGGDFYDFYFIGKNKFVFLIADVSGKGIPAAMFMMTAKAIIKNYAESGMSPDKILEKTNNDLCENNSAEMFVTAWLGVIDLETGTITYACAGHNPPLISVSGREYEYIKTKPGFVLAGMTGIKYTCHTLQLYPGDSVFLYTDGITEAENEKNELFGGKRLSGILNSEKRKNAWDICLSVKRSVKDFAGKAPQSDDITMLAFIYRGQNSQADK